jgi:hypothetical protein
VQSDYGWDSDASEATIFSKRGSPRRERKTDNEKADNSLRGSHANWLRKRGQPVDKVCARLGCGVSPGNSAKPVPVAAEWQSVPVETEQQSVSVETMSTRLGLQDLKPIRLRYRFFSGPNL